MCRNSKNVEQRQTNTQKKKKTKKLCTHQGFHVNATPKNVTDAECRPFGSGYNCIMIRCRSLDRIAWSGAVAHFHQDSEPARVSQDLYRSSVTRAGSKTAFFSFITYNFLSFPPMYNINTYMTLLCNRLFKHPKVLQTEKKTKIVNTTMTWSYSSSSHPSPHQLCSSKQ